MAELLVARVDSGRTRNTSTVSPSCNPGAVTSTLLPGSTFVRTWRAACMHSIIPLPQRLAMMGRTLLLLALPIVSSEASGQQVQDDAASAVTTATTLYERITAAKA